MIFFVLFYSSFIKIYVKIIFYHDTSRNLIVLVIFSCILEESLLAAGACTVIAVLLAAGTSATLAVAISAAIATATITGILKQNLKFN